MSRTKKGNKGPGYEYWGRRSALPKVDREPGPFTKRQTHHAERRVAKRVITEEVSDA